MSIQRIHVFNQTSVKHGWLDQSIEVVVLNLLIW